MHFNRVFHYFHDPFWGFSPYFWKHPCISNMSHPMMFFQGLPRDHNLRRPGWRVWNSDLVFEVTMWQNMVTSWRDDGLAHLRWSPYSRTAPLSIGILHVGPTKSLIVSRVFPKGCLVGCVAKLGGSVHPHPKIHHFCNSGTMEFESWTTFVPGCKLPLFPYNRGWSSTQ